MDAADDAPTQFFRLPNPSAPGSETDENGPVFIPAPVRRAGSPGASLATDDTAAFIAIPGGRPAGDDTRIPDAAQPPVADQAPAAPENATGSGVLLTARALRREVGKGKVILRDISLIARPREFVAVVGGSGAGKSTLLGALSGQRRPTSGTVLLDGVPLYEHFEALRQRIGYVPQDDVIHRELTVERALGYAAELRLPPSWTGAQRDARIDEVLRELGLEAQRKTVVANLSGGQRKRVSIGVELLTRPELFFLDEPTSGIDPGLEHHMMQLLRSLADQGRTVLLITHATRSLMLCDKVLVLAVGGRMAYYGSPKDALSYFGVQEIDEIYGLVNETRTPEEWEARFRATDAYERLTAEVEQAGEPSAPAVAPAIRAATAADERRESWRQFRILTRRYTDTVVHDRKNLAILLLQAPLLALLLFALFSSNVFQRPNDEWLFIPRLADQLDVIQLTPENSADVTRALDRAKALDAARAPDPGVALTGARVKPQKFSGLPELVFYHGPDCSTLELGETCAQDATAGNGNAGKAAQLIFILAAVAVWLGTLNAIREVSKEDAIYRRERMVNLRVMPYLASKFAVLFALVLVQCTLLLLIAAMHISFPGAGIVGIWLALVLGATAAVSLALAVSSAVSNPDRAIFAAPLIMLPQILLAGLIVPVSNLGAAQPLAALVTSRWAYEAAGRAAGVVNAAAFPPGFLYRSALDGTAFVPLTWLLLLMAVCAGAAVLFQRRKDSF